MAVGVLDRSAGRETGAFASIDALAGNPVEWRRRTLFSRDFDLMLGDRVFATLHYAGALRRWAELRSADGAWEIRRRGLWLPGIAIHRAGHDQPLAGLERTIWGRGTLQFASGARYGWRRLSLWRGRYAILSDAGRVLLLVRGSTFPGGSRVRIHVTHDAEDCRDLAVLAGVACYLRLLIAARSSS